MTTQRLDQRIRLRDRITGQEHLVDVDADADCQLQKEMLPPQVGVGPRYEQLYNPAPMRVGERER